jgi:phosphoenolpyruvate synthase/pyruvate phosphate dikinase
MRGPEHVYPAVLLMQTVAAEKSGVMITQDVDTGDSKVISVAVNEGVVGAVDGQAAESLRVNTDTAQVRLMAVATAPTRLVPKASGGVDSLPASGAETLLQPGEIQALIDFAKRIPTEFPQRDGNGAPAAADVEFAFIGGKLWLLQIRPFNESRQARGSQHLMDMDRALATGRKRRIDLTEVAK